MSNRKILAEVEKCEKKTREDLTEYKALYEKFDDTTESALRIKIEAELKKSIKKLQRHRDSIKGYIASPEIKDTDSLEKLRKEIEALMLQFREIEREVKTKAFSKEALARDTGDSSVARLGSAVKGITDVCKKQIELAEYDLNRHRKKKSNEGANKIELLRRHVYNLDTLVHMAQNEEVDADEALEMVNKLKDVLVEDASMEDLGQFSAYLPFDIPEQPAVPEPAPAKPAAASPAPTPSSAGEEKKKTPAATKSTQPTPAEPPRQEPQQQQQQPQPQQQQPSPQQQLDDDMDAKNDDTFGDSLPSAGGAGTLADISAATQKHENEWEKRRLERNSAAKAAAAASAAPAAAPPAPAAQPQQQPQQQQQQQQQKPQPQQTQPQQAQQPQQAPQAQQPARTSPQQEQQHHSRTQRQVEYTAEQLNAMLDMSLTQLPYPQVVDKVRATELFSPIAPIQGFPPVAHPAFNTVQVYRHFDLDTLFYIFYHRYRTAQQYLAAKVLKSRSFRFHTGNHRWYLRKEKPVQTEPDFERGAFYYFDYENKWQLQVDEDFTFEYKYLEQEF